MKITVGQTSFVDTLIFNRTITPAIFAAVIAVAVLVIIIKNKTAVLSALSRARVKLFTRSGFFWSSIFVFMAVSVLQAGAFFSISGDAIGLPLPFF